MGVATLKRVGMTLVSVGALLVGFVAYQLWGTALSEHAAQARLRAQLESQLRAQRAHAYRGGDGGSADSPTLVGPTSVATTDQPPTGAPIGFLSIPRIGMNGDAIVQGVGDDQLRQGPGHYPGTPLPGQAGNAAIAGHRTTYAAPFYNLDQLQAGDAIIVQTLQGTFHYAVAQTLLVAPTDSTVLDPTTQPELTLTTCNPRYSATQRLVVVALLQNPQGGPRPLVAGTSTSPGTTPRRHTQTAATALAGSGGGGNIAGALLWGLLTAGATLGLWLLWRRVRRRGRWGVLVLGTPVVLGVLFVFFGHVSAVLPASF